MSEPTSTDRDPALRHDPAVADPPARLRERLAAVRALVLDVDGVILRAGRPIPGAAEALRDLDARGIPYRILTNSGDRSRAARAELFAGLGLPIPAARIVTSISVAAAYTAARHAGQALYVIAAPDALTEFAGQRLLDAAEADAPGARVAAVVIADAGDELSYRNLDRAFRLVRGGARLLAAHRTLWWLTSRGPTLDVGAFVAGLERATGTRATVLGKPAPFGFRAAAHQLAAELAARGEPGLPRQATAMVGDDVGWDVLAARRAGLRGVLVLSGRHGPDDIAAAARRSRRPGTSVVDAIAPSLAAVVAAMG